jgi:hypothetical protein
MSPKADPPKSPFDADGRRLRVDDPVISTPLYAVRGEVCTGTIVSTKRNLITVLHETGPWTGQRWRCAAHLWRYRA